MQKIAHICLCGTVTPGGTYQDNLLSKYHVKQGNSVSLITSCWIQDGKGGHCLYPQTDYINSEQVHVIRLSMIGTQNPYKKFKLFKNFYEVLNQIQPDVLFIHDCQMLNMFTIVRYLKKHLNVKVYVDNHADFSNSAHGWLSKNILHKIIWRICAHMIEPYAIKFYGTLPARVDFLKDIYKLPAHKCELLVMGADDEMVEKANKPQVRAKIRQKYGIEENDFLIVTGGKIDAFKTQTLLLMQAVKNIQNPNVKLLMFGSIAKELQPQVQQLTDGHKIQSIGWIDGQLSYQYFAAADLVCFPGRHSVFWEQVVGQGIPMLVKDWPGTHHVDVGGNVHFLTQDSVDEIQRNIEELLTNPVMYRTMKQVAQNNGMKYFSYREIAKRSIGD